MSRISKIHGSIFFFTIYLLVWVAGVLVFWLTPIRDDALGYSVLYLGLILPAVTVVCSIFIGKFADHRKWFWIIPFGIMHMLAEYTTFSIANNIAFHKVNLPEFGMIAAGAAWSLVGIAIGHLIYIVKSNSEYS